MTKITRFDTASCRVLTDALEKLGEQFGLSIKVESGSFQRNNFRCKVEAKVLGEDGTMEASDKAEFELHAPRFGLKPEMFGQTVSINDRPFTICGIRKNAHKNVVCIKSKAGKVFQTSADLVLGKLGAKPKRPDSEILADLQVVEAELSPENLSCDGEASPSWIRRESARLGRRKKELELELGRRPSILELIESLR